MLSALCLPIGATSVAIWAVHRLRLAYHRKEMYYEALKVRWTPSDRLNPQVVWVS